MSTDWLISAAEALAQLPAPPAEQFLYLLEHGTAKIGLYAPRGTDPQGPHKRDEIYVVWRGRGSFERDGERRGFAPGDVIFVPAGMTHRFVDFDDDFAAWVIFYGPPGGETLAPADTPPD
ncbi:MAG: cupin domain-containing protein [Aliidongia sp.]